jgi:hypothetical protein
MNARRLNRRTLIQGVGCSLSLPLLDAMLPRSAFAAAPQPPVRMAFVSFPNGAIMPAWTPKKDGANYDLPETLQSLVEVKGEINMITGLAQNGGRALGDGAGDHARSSASLLTGTHPVKTSGANIRCGQSVDQAAAEHAGQFTRLPSLELGTERGRDAGSCDSGYACAYSNSISWKSASTPMAKEINPRLAFERMFSSGSKDDQSQARRSRVRQSVLDLVAADAQQLRRGLGRTDQQKIDEYFNSVRELEQRVSRAEHVAKVETPDFKTPESVPSDVREHIRLMYDLMTLAFQTDTTRIITFMVANEGSNRSYRMVDVNSGHHELSHHRNEEDKVNSLKRIDRFLADEFGRFLKNLHATREGAGSLLDNSMVMYGSGLSDGNRHQHDNLPIVLAGRAGGTIKTGRHIRMASETPLNNLFVSMLDRMQVKIHSLGDSTGRLSALDG